MLRHSERWALGMRTNKSCAYETTPMHIVCDCKLYPYECLQENVFSLLVKSLHGNLSSSLILYN